MKPIYKLLTSLFVWATLFAAHLTSASDWPQFRGPDRSDVSPETGLLKQWPEGGPEQVWLSREVGLGYSGPAVVGGKIYLMGAKGNEEWLICLEEQSGKTLWTSSMGPKLENDWGDGPRGTPTVDGDRVYALSGQGKLVCASTADGSIEWSKTMQSLGGSAPKWGYSESVLVDGDLLVCTPGGDEGTMVALDKKTGEKVWQSEDWTDQAQYASIIPAEIHGIKQFVQLTQKHFAGISAQDGSLLWQAEWRGRTAVIPTPIVQDQYVYITAGYGAGSALVEIDETQEVSDIYRNKVMKNQHGGVILVDDHLYGYSDAVGWVCQNFMTGEKVWAERQALGKGAIAYADGRLYCLEENTGTVALVEASPKGWNEISRFTLSPQTEQRSPRGKIWVHPVIANGKLYLRDQELFFCFDISG